MSREDAQMKIRLPADLRDQIVAAAEGAKRSLNAEIVARLEQSFVLDPQYEALEATAADSAKRIEMLERAFVDIAELLQSPKKAKG